MAHFLEFGLLERHDDQVQLTLLGPCGQSSLAFNSGIRLIEAIRSTSGSELTAFKLVGLIQMLPEADSLYTPVRKKARTEGIRVSQAASRFGDAVVQALRRWVGDEIAFWGRCKRAAILADWMEGASIQEIDGSRCPLADRCNRAISRGSRTPPASTFARLAKSSRRF